MQDATVSAKLTFDVSCVVDLPCFMSVPANLFSFGELTSSSLAPSATHFILAVFQLTFSGKRRAQPLTSAPL